MSLADRTVYVHIGPPKTGTTYLQEVMWRNRSRLAEQGMTFPGDGPVSHFHAALDLREIRFGGHDNPEVPGAWARLMRRVERAETGSVVISHEVLSGAKPDEIDRVGHDLTGAEVHVVCGARDLARQLRAVWQESLKNRRTREFEPFLDAALDGRERPALPGGFWRGQDVVGVLRRWSVITEPGNTHVVTVPRGGTPSDVLWNRFAQAVGVTSEGFDLTVAGSNASLNTEDAELLRRLNGVLPEDLPWPTYERLVKGRFRRLAREHTGTGTPIRIPSRYADVVADYATAAQGSLATAGYDIVGDLADLGPDTASFDTDRASARQDQATASAIVSDAEVDSLAEEIMRKASRRVSSPRSQARTLMTQLRRRTQRSR